MFSIVHEKNEYDEHEFFVGERVFFAHNHTGSETIRFCPYPSHPIAAGLIDWIEFIIDYNPIAKTTTFVNYTKDPKSNKSVRRFLMLYRSQRMVCIDYYSLSSLTRTHCMLVHHAQCLNADVVVVVAESLTTKITPRMLLAVLSKAVSYGVLVCLDNVYETVKEICVSFENNEDIRSTCPALLRTIVEKLVSSKITQYRL